MKKGHLSEYFTGVAMKRLSAVEANASISHQHEYNGAQSLKLLFGTAMGRQKFPARFIYLSDCDDEPVVCDGFLTWYDARKNHAVRSEHRLYFPTTTVSECAAEGDLLLIGRRPDGSVLVVIAENESTIGNQVQWLFGITNLTHPGYSIREELETEQDRIAFASRFILEAIGIAVEAPPETHLDEMLRRLGGEFPTTRDFSAYARSTTPETSPSDDVDAALMAWMEREEILFRTLERHLIGDRLRKGFTDNVDSFISFSLSVQNRRKSRVGYALENHLENLFTACGIRYSRNAVTENKSKPDFLFPGINQYRDSAFDPQSLMMLGVKSSCKDRWRQVLVEADRVEQKHLLTLETAISSNQTNEMQSKKLQLVLPRQLHTTYVTSQQAWLMDLAAFTTLAKESQKRSA
jgi:EcoRII C terminal